MLYSGHFSFDEFRTPDKERHGYFTCIVRAGSPELALQKFKQRIQTIMQDLKEPLFENVTAIYVEDIVEISHTPDDAIVTRFQSSEGAFPKSVSCSLPTTDSKKIKAYRWFPKTDPSLFDRDTIREDDYEFATPFLTFP